MVSAETAELPKDRKGRTLRLPYEVMVCCDGNPIAQGGATSLTLAMLCPAAWYTSLQRDIVRALMRAHEEEDRKKAMERRRASYEA